MLGHYRCSYCGDTWCRDLDDMEVSAYMAERPDVDLSKVTDIDLGEVLCDGCEDYSYQDDDMEAENDPNSAYYDPDDDDENDVTDDTFWLICEECGRDFECDLDTDRDIWDAEEKGVPVTCGNCDAYAEQRHQKAEERSNL